MNDNLPKLRTFAEMENEQPTFLSGDGWVSADIRDCFLDFTEPYKRPFFALSYNRQPFARLGDVQVISGQAGHGKSMLLSQIIAALLKGEFGGLRYELADTFPNPKVLLIDTEQSENDVIECKNRVLDLCGFPLQEPREDFFVAMLRSTESAEERWRKTLRAIWEIKPNIIILDGLLDVVRDFNSQTDCAEIIYKCLQIATYYNAAMMCVLHQNPQSQKLVGHLGSAAMRKVSDIFVVKKSKDKNGVSFKVTEEKARGHQDIDDWEFRVIPTAWGRPEQITTASPSKEISIEQIEVWLRAGQGDIDWPADLSAVKQIFRERGKIKGNDALQDCIRRAKNRRFLVEQPRDEWNDGQKYPKYNLNLL